MTMLDETIERFRGLIAERDRIDEAIAAIIGQTVTRTTKKEAGPTASCGRPKKVPPAVGRKRKSAGGG